MTALSSMATTFRDHFTPSGRRASKPERAARKASRKANARRIRDGVQKADGPDHLYD